MAKQVADFLYKKQEDGVSKRWIGTRTLAVHEARSDAQSPQKGVAKADRGRLPTGCFG